MLTVSAVIPTYNGTRFLVAAVKSVIAQTYKISEIIVVDDGSKEDIKSILAPFSPRVSYVYQENAGPAAARNKGVSIAKGDLIAFLDDDDLWNSNKTEEQINCISKYPKSALVYSYPQLIDEQGNIIPNELPSNFPSGFVYKEFLKMNRIITPSTTLIKREVFNTVGFFDENREYMCGEDYDLWLRITKKYEVSFCPGAIVSYRMRNSGISKNLDNALKGKLYLIDKLVSRHAENPTISDKEFYSALNYNLHYTYRTFAYDYYYKMDERRKARWLIMKALRYYPFCFKDIIFLLSFLMPKKAFQLVRNLKRFLCRMFVE
jgi:glycosyltransferase involved in cell wall biosynthesis